ncbi:MAG: hypothetical protein KDB22_25485 [Planctomycetales bacterium]|nr:hypothetical protein [Planctomycetales bacterium]
MNSCEVRRPPSPGLGWFGLRGQLACREYFTAGLILVPLKYLTEALVIRSLTGRSFSPLDFINPWLSSREHFAADAPVWLGMAWILWSLPFLWLAITLSIRRALDAGLSPWLGLLVVVPIVNLALILVLALVPTSSATQTKTRDRYLDPFESPRTMEATEEESVGQSAIASAVVGLLAGAIYLVTFVVFSVYVINSYGTALFFGTPIITGSVAAYVLNRRRPRSLAKTLGHSALTLSVACISFLLFGLEGILCIVMAIPLMVPLGLFGALIGRSIAVSLQRSENSEQGGLIGCLALLPVIAWGETIWQREPTYEVVSRTEIAAPIEDVWEQVVHFSEITDQPAWYFRLGIAYPTRARIEGAGVGALRYCEFSTGTFVEPITAWEQPTRLAFDVSAQPEPMFELTPYRHIHPPHLTGSFRSTRGEFRLTEISANRTLIEGSTWYQLKIRPAEYWTVWTDWILHRIHYRVLDHIKRSCETAVANGRFKV